MPHGIAGSAPQCKAKGCERLSKARGWCNGHYEQWRRTGMEPSGPLEPRTPRGARCRIAECPNPATARGWCNGHYLRWSRYGDPLASAAPGPSAEERFWARVDKSGPVPDYAPQLGPCWVWTAKAKHRLGYGVLTVAGKRWGAHGYAYTLIRGPVPEGLELDHLCRVPACVNPDHLEPVTHQENLQRADWTGNRNRPRATHCKRGHPFDEENTVVRPNGKRLCRICRNANVRERRKKHG